MPMFGDGAKLASRPKTWLLPAATVESERFVNSTPTVLRRSTSRRTRGDGEVGGRHAERADVVGADVEAADAVPADPSGEAGARVNRNGGGALQADAPAVEDRGRIAASAAAHAAEREDALPFEEEVALLWKLQVEARQVHLRFVHLDLREVGVVGEVGGQALRQAVLDVEARRPGPSRSARPASRDGRWSAAMPRRA